MNPELRSHAILDLATHLTAAGEWTFLRRLLLEFDYLHLKVSYTGPETLIADIDVALNGDAEPCPDGDRAALALLRDAMNMSAQVIAANGRQLVGQLLARLAGNSGPDLENLLEKGSARRGAVWIKPHTRVAFREAVPWCG